NRTDSFTYLDSPETNGHPERKLFVTPVYNPYGHYTDHPLGVQYDIKVSRWYIYTEDGGLIDNGAAFNVVVKDEQPGRVYTHTATMDNSPPESDHTYLNEPLVSRRTDSFVFITRYLNVGPFFNHLIGACYDGTWEVFIEGGGVFWTPK